MVIHFLQIRLGATYNYAVTLENELLSLGVFQKFPKFEINKTRIHDLYPTDCGIIDRGRQRTRSTRSRSQAPSTLSKDTAKKSRHKSSPRRTQESPDITVEFQTSTPKPSANTRAQHQVSLADSGITLDDESYSLVLTGKSSIQSDSTEGRLCDEDEDPYHDTEDKAPEFINHPYVDSDYHTNKLNQEFVRVFDFPAAYTNRNTWDPKGPFPRLPQPVICVRKQYTNNEFAVYGVVTGISRDWQANSKRTGYHFHFLLSRSGTSLQVWFNNPDQRKTETLYKKIQKLVNTDTYMMIDQYTVGKPFPSALEDTYKYGIGINSGTALRVFEVIRQPVPGSRHTKGDVDFGSSFEIAKDQKRPVKKARRSSSTRRRGQSTRGP